MALHPLILNLLGMARAKVQDIVCNAHANVKQEFLLAIILSTVPVKTSKAEETMKMSPHMVKVVNEPTSKPQMSKNSLFVTPLK